MAKLLVIDDSATSRAIVARLVGPDHETRLCGDGPSALALLEEEGFDAVLLDLLMPGMDGPSVLREIASRHPELPVLVITADIQDTTRERVLGLGASAIVNKPLRREGLLAGIAAVLGGLP